MQPRKARVLSVGTFVPDTVVTNDDLAKQVDTSNDWIVTRTGIRERRIVNREAPLENYELGARAAQVALDRAGVAAGDVDCVICATFTPDCFFPSTACRMQQVLGCTSASAFDISAACSGFIYGLSIADSMIRCGQVRTVLLVGAELISRTIDWTDRGTCILFGDGAGAVVVRADEGDRGVLATRLASDGSKGDILCLPAFGDNRYMRMKGNEVFKHAVRLMGDIAIEACSDAAVRVEEIDALVPHQANIRIINGLAERLGVPMEKVITNIERYGNTSSASIPLALDEAWSSGRVGEGSLAVLTALGGGVTVGGAVVRL